MSSEDDLALGAACPGHPLPDPHHPFSKRTQPLLTNPASPFMSRPDPAPSAAAAHIPTLHTMSLKQRSSVPTDPSGGSEDSEEHDDREESLFRRFMRPSPPKAIPAHLATTAGRVSLTSAALGLLAGLCMQRALGLLWHLVVDPASATRQPSTSGRFTCLREILASPQLNAYLTAWSLFHLAEFWITANWNGTRLMEDSFLLQNGVAYHVAHLAGLLEYFLRNYFWSSQDHVAIRWWSYIGLVLVMLGQVARSLAMLHAAGSFSHEVAHGAKRADHTLVTDGIYAFTRHPSYVGFFYWALGTQILLGNPVSFCAFAVTLWRFFRHRLVGEEYSLRQFFPKDYDAYAKRVGTGLPFIK